MDVGYLVEHVTLGRSLGRVCLGAAEPATEPRLELPLDRGAQCDVLAARHVGKSRAMSDRARGRVVQHQGTGGSIVVRNCMERLWREGSGITSRRLSEYGYSML